MLRDGERYVLDFPAMPAEPVAEPAGLFAALGATPRSIFRSLFLLCVFETEEQVRAMEPNMFALNKPEYGGVIVTAPGSDCDFVSRMFAPAMEFLKILLRAARIRC